MKWRLVMRDKGGLKKRENGLEATKESGKVKVEGAGAGSAASAAGATKDMTNERDELSWSNLLSTSGS